jgi:NAD-dependent SIR2 family protein deacetylase
MSEQYTAEVGRETPTIEPEKEPEYVGAHSALAAEQCQNWIGETTDEVEQCEREATHTVVMFHGKLSEIAMCDRCGEPEDVDDYEREWTGEVLG